MNCNPDFSTLGWSTFFKIHFLPCHLKIVQKMSKGKLGEHTVRNLHFLSKNSTLISRENCWFFGWKARENVVVLDILAVDNFDFTWKIVKKSFGKNSWKCWGLCQNWIFGQKFEFSNSVKLRQTSRELMEF